MKKVSILMALLWFMNTGYSQSENLPDPRASFMALIVNNIDSSMLWYAENLGFEKLYFTVIEERKIKQANLKRGSVSLELIEFGELKDKSLLLELRGSRMYGFFKFGFELEKFDQWIEHLSLQDPEIYNHIVTDPLNGKKMVIVKDPDRNRIQLFEH